MGKLPNPVLGQLLGRIGVHDPRVVVGPGVGLDAAVIDIGERYLVAKTDPITFASDSLGWYAVHVNANDIVCMGATPRWFLATLLLPEGAGRQLAERILGQVIQACEALDLALVGGHTEITHGIDHPILVGCLLGEVEKDALITGAGARPGDALILAGGIPIEAVSILARERGAALRDRFEAEYLERCRNFLFEPGISVVPAARAALATGQVHAMHDPTEGGLATGLWELAHASGQTIEVQVEKISVLPEGQALCEALGLDPLASIASGALLLTTAAAHAEQLQGALDSEGVTSSVIGKVLESAGDPQVFMIEQSERRPLQLPERDEIARLFDPAAPV